LNIIPVESARERDIDMLLLEELSVNDVFCSWFVSNLELPIYHKGICVLKSVTLEHLGESDLYFLYESEGEKVLVLIENKLDTIFQENQYDRYKKRAKRYMERGECHKAYYVLVAPENYPQGSFEKRISYEEIAKKLSEDGTRRSSFKAEILRIAIEKERRGYSPINDEKVLSFLKSYYKVQQFIYPEIGLNDREKAGSRADWVNFKEDRLQGIKIIHKLKDGYVDATFFRYSSELIPQLELIKPNEANIAYHEKSFSLRISVSKVIKEEDFAGQSEAISKGIGMVELLHKWLLAHREEFLGYYGR
jgi:hypothetical protein